MPDAPAAAPATTPAPTLAPTPPPAAPPVQSGPPVGRTPSRPGPALPQSPAKAAAMDRLRKLGKPPEGVTKEAAPPTPPAKADATPPPAPAKADATPTPEPAKAPEGDKPTPTPPADAKPATPPIKGKESPWKLVESYKSKAASLERQLVEAQKQAGDPQAAIKLSQRAEAAEARLKELESEMRYHNYAKTTEFKEKYQEPYEKAWAKAVSDVTQLNITEADGQVRRATANDLWRVITQPLGEATKLAKEMFGEDLGNYVMAHHYGKVRDLAEAQQDALEKARKEGTDREQAQAHTTQKIHSEVAQAFERVRDEDAAKLDFLKEKEGDDDWNSRLSQSVDFVDTTMRSSVFDTKLSSEERSKLVARHVQVRNRAVGYSMLKLENTRLRAELAERDKKLASYQQAQPGAGDGKPGTTETQASGAPMGSMATAKAKLRALGKPI